ncbi:hypothetical protein BH24BAC1_BH24BAC1_41260 [soil metagenome]
MKALILILLPLLVAFVGMSHQKRRLQPQGTLAEISNAHSPYLTTDPEGNLVMSWVSQCSNEEPALLKFAVSPDWGRSFRKAVTVPGSVGTGCAQGENPPKVALKAAGTIIAVFRVDQPSEAHPHGGDVYTVSSTDGGQSWSSGQSLWGRNDRTQGFFDLKILPDGEVGVLWVEEKAGPAGSGTSATIRFAKTQADHTFGPSLIISPSVCQGCKVRLHVDSRNQIHTLFWKILEEGAHDIAYSFSADNGSSFSSPRNVSPARLVSDLCPESGPDLITFGKTMHVAWLAQGVQTGLYTTSTRNKRKKFTPRTLITESSKASNPSVTALPKGLQVFAWDEDVAQGDRVRKRKGVKTVDPNGNSFTCFLDSPEDLVRPVVWGADEKKVFVAYTKTDGDFFSVVFESFQVM